MTHNFNFPTRIFTAIGLATTAYFVQRSASFVWFYYLRPSSLHKFLQGGESYALITGASDGIGRALAQELYGRGFSLILHGRNEAKLKGVIEDIRASTKGAGRDIRYFIASADAADVDFNKIVEAFKDLHITLLINNVGGGGVRSERIDSYSEEQLLGDLRLNALFPFNLTHAFLPQLRAANGPVEVIFVGSRSADITIPRLTTYAPPKIFLCQLARCLNADERFGPPSQVRFTYWNVGTVATKGLGTGTKPNLFNPLASTFARSLMGVIGCGKEKLIPYAPHALQELLTGLAPQRVLERHATKVIQALIAEHAKHAKSS